MANVGERCWAWIRDEARKSGRDPQTLASSYAIERFMERLMRLDRDGCLTVKGGQAMGILLANEMRPTKDLDLDYRAVDGESVNGEPAIALLRAACGDRAEDGVFYDAAAMSIEVRKHQGDGGYRISVPCTVHTCRSDFVVDLGVGNEISFEPRVWRLPGILGKRKSPPPAAEVRIYPLENSFAEKLACKVEDGAASIRHKDFYDVWVFVETALRLGDLSLLDRKAEEMDAGKASLVSEVRQALSDATVLDMPECPVADACIDRLGYALARTFAHRGCALPDDLSGFLEQEFAGDAKQCAQWANWCRNNLDRLRIHPPMVAGRDARTKALGALIERIGPFVDEVRKRVPQPSPAPR